MKYRFERSIIFKILIFFLLFGQLLLLTMTGTFLNFAQDKIHDSVNRELTLSGETIVKEFENTRARIEATAIAMAQLAQFLPSDTATQHELVRNILNTRPHETIVSGGVWPLPYHLDPSKERSSIFFAKDSNGTLSFNDGYNQPESEPYFDEPWFAPMRLFKPQELLWSRHYTDPLTHVDMLTASVPIYAQERLFGVATIDINLHKITPLLNRFAKEIDGYAFLLDRDDTLISISEHELKTLPHLEALQQNYPGITPMIAALDRLKQKVQSSQERIESVKETLPNIDDPQVVVEIARILTSLSDKSSAPLRSESYEISDDPLLHSKSFGIIYEIPDTHWRLGLVTSYDHAFAKSEALLWKIFWISLAITLLVTFIGYLVLHRLIAKPLLRIKSQLASERSNQIRDLVTLEESGSDEIGQLVSALNARTETLRELYREIEDTQKEVVFTMGAIGESRSKETGNHVKRVAEYSYLLAKYYGLDEEECEKLKQASPMHDIGKVAIPDAILNKPGRFEPDERAIMETHAALGYEMLKHSQRPLLLCAAYVANEHHEHWNGNGYPRGLKGEAIHIYGRITAVADVFDALGSDRCYKKAWEDERIFALFKEERGKQFDPRLIDIFFEHLDEFLAIRERLRDSFE